MGVPYCGLLGTGTQPHHPARPFAGLLVAQNGAVLGVVPHQAIAAPDYSLGMQQVAVQGGAKDSKFNISHSTIEKQRRDRINSLIDELRELVPSAGAVRGPDGSDMKRPKHVVLSDTITLLKALRDKSERDQEQLHELKRIVSDKPAAPAAAAAAAAANAAQQAAAAPQELSSAQSLLQRSLSGAAGAAATEMCGAAAAVAAAAAGASVCPELPQAPAHLPASVGVLVEEGPGCFLVKVNCKDRRGLLGDIASALGGLPLQITRAAITTSHGGCVYDVFEIALEPNAETEGITALDVQFQVHMALHKYSSSRAGRAIAAAATAAAAAAAAAEGGESREASPPSGTTSGSGDAEGVCYDANKRRRSE
uniref:BHLH domain-containing protein n=1 Tax=Tetradesmus obliquus TaxID=3088 RepID=A0A383VKF3_TETOB|eukprot:jgi/Sobl393_1/19431/SZX65997.1